MFRSITLRKPETNHQTPSLPMPRIVKGSPKRAHHQIRYKPYTWLRGTRQTQPVWQVANLHHYALDTSKLDCSFEWNKHLLEYFPSAVSHERCGIMAPLWAPMGSKMLNKNTISVESRLHSAHIAPNLHDWHHCIVIRPTAIFRQT